MATPAEFDYTLQVWTIKGVIQRCEHPSTMRQHSPCCTANRLHGLTIEQANDLLDRPNAVGQTYRQALV